MQELWSYDTLGNDYSVMQYHIPE